jgi:hypothetical protein
MSDYHVEYGITLNDKGYSITKNQTVDGSPENWYFNQTSDILYSHITVVLLRVPGTGTMFQLLVINVGINSFLSLNSGILPASFAAVYFWDSGVQHVHCSK